MIPRAPVVIDLGVVGRLPSDAAFGAEAETLTWTPAPDPRPRPTPFGVALLAILTCVALVGPAAPVRPGLTELYTVQMTRAWYALDAEVFYLVTGSGEVTAYGLKGADAAKFDEIAKLAESKCPVSNAYRGTMQITVETKVV